MPKRSPTLGAIAGNTSDQGPEPQLLAQKGEGGRILRKDRLSHSVIQPLCLQCGFINDLDNYLGVMIIKLASEAMIKLEDRTRTWR